MGQSITRIEDEDAKAILLNNLPSNYGNVIFILTQFSFKSLNEMVRTILGEEKRIKTSDEEEKLQIEMALFFRGRVHKK